MKKTILLSIFAAALFASCAGSGEKNQSGADSVAVVEEAEAVAVIDSSKLVVVELSEVAQLKNAEKPVIIPLNLSIICSVPPAVFVLTTGLHKIIAAVIVRPYDSSLDG